MKRVLFFICMLVSAFAVQAQENPLKQHDAVIKKMLERYTAPPNCKDCDSTGIMLVRLEKKAGKLHTQFLFNSVKNATVLDAALLNNAANKDKIESIPEGFHCTVPVLFFYGSNDGKMHLPTAIAKQQYEEQLIRLRGKERIIGEVVVVGYAPTNKTAPQP